MKKIRIVLAEDDEDDRLFFKEAINQLDLNTEIKFVADGDELLKYLNDPESHFPDLVFLDLNMPRKGGIQSLSEIRASQKLTGLSVAIYSTSSSDEDIENCFIGGANVYIKKPNNIESLKSVLFKVITTNHQYINSTMNKDNFLMVV
ncbi:response regulator [Aquiflexum sp.]|uniref:response regulator n=1 Tax=Aquiflexum sp. TaxID=1872584 RepID=UPI003593BFF9